MATFSCRITLYLSADGKVFKSSRYVVENNSLKVSSPENLKGVYKCAISDFGVPQHGGTLTGVVVYPKLNQEACKSFTHEFSFKTKSNAGSLPVFLLADGRDCYFSLKAWNAQNAGAAGVLIAYDEFLTSMYNVPEELDGYKMESITIPSAVVSRSLGDSIKKALYEGEFVRVNLEWTEASAHEDEQVDMNKNVVDPMLDEHEYWDVNQSCDQFVWRFIMINIKRWLMFLWEKCC
ncbi:hypothetical protein QVD17_16908 [Tagetes erecta]|uniref:PA domain-containing protein n=1 Tax=Tagetes erecta TaxID=13708 RepID=A0AAD8KYI9_TARER|nr:hypothetical protein QVD17_16908 [Tagetes erecta]